MPLLNYSSHVPASRTADEIMGILGKHGAEGFSTEHGRDGQIIALTWHVGTPYGVMPFRLPVSVEATLAVLMRQKVLKHGDERDYEQARRCAWRITKVWIAAQMALLETEMVTVDQLFLPYLRVTEDETLYDRLGSTHFFESLRESGIPALLPGRE